MRNELEKVTDGKERFVREITSFPNYRDETSHSEKGEAFYLHFGIHL